MLARSNNQLGQGLVELAILGSILIMVIAFLFSLGINYNRYQDLVMRTTRNTRAMAYNPNFRDHQRLTTLTMVEDKPNMDFSSSSIQPNYSSYSASASESWSDKLYWDYDPKFGDWNEMVSSILDLPSQNFLVNGNFIYIQDKSYREKFVIAVFNGDEIARQRIDINLLTGKGMGDCIPGLPVYPSWCWKAKKISDLKAGDSADFFNWKRLSFDGKEELILRRIDASDTIIGGICDKLGWDCSALNSAFQFFLILNDQKAPIDATINSTDYFRLGKDKQGLRGNLRIKSFRLRIFRVS